MERLFATPRLSVHPAFAARFETCIASFLPGFPAIDHALVNVGDSLLMSCCFMSGAGTQIEGTANGEDQHEGHTHGMRGNGLH